MIAQKETGIYRVPRMVYEEITKDSLIAEARKHVPPGKPLYQLFDVVFVSASFNSHLPGVVVGVEARNNEGWHYSILRPRYLDGIMERETYKEKDLKPDAA